MIIMWPPKKITSVCDLPSVGNVKFGVVYDNGNRIGTYVPGITPQNTGFVAIPNVSDAMLDWFLPMVFTTIVKTIVNFQNVETPTLTNFRGVWQPFTSQQLQLKPEGQRAWKWFMLHADVSLALSPDDVVSYQGVQYRVMEKTDYTLYGYIEYHLVMDYTGSGPT